MNWLTNFVRPKISSLVKTRNVPDNLWEKCSFCNNMVFHRELEANCRICTHCGYHMRISVTRRLELLFDDGKYNRIEMPAVKEDPLKFKDMKKYADRLKAAKKKTKEEDALVVAHGTMGGNPIVVAAFNFDFMAGSMGTAVGEAFVAAADLAMLQQAAFIAIPTSGGARMQEGILSLMQMARTTVAVQKIKEKSLPYIVLLTDPTTGGVSASFAMLGDVALAEPRTTIGFAGARVIEQTIREKLPEGFQKAEYLLEKGMIDMVVERNKLRCTLINLVDMFLNPKKSKKTVKCDCEKADGKNGKKTNGSSKSSVKKADGKKISKPAVKTGSSADSKKAKTPKKSSQSKK
ncbi:MAG: acetyl-CoA carboxylase carboxyltransferase subunit beta [Alphaproteobacteria bacterium]|nr:acetyl-CoA carboxylase carboxyltransferase subunit beta [Alphaproteobacteria bacterium]